MGPGSAPCNHRLLTDLTTIKLALQLLERTTSLTIQQGHLTAVALAATNALTTELVQSR
jgi:hypothetical protein